MSMSSVRRIKERGGGGGAKITAAATSNAVEEPIRSTKTSTPVSEKSISGIAGGTQSLRRSATGKENPRPISRSRASAVQQPKPTIRAMPRIDKSSAMAGINKNAVGELSRTRWSTSSVPRGRSPSPSEFTRVLSDMKKSSRVTKVTVDRPVQEKKVNSRVSNEKSDIDKKNNEIRKWVSNGPKNESFREIETKSEKSEKPFIMVSNDSAKKDVSSSSELIKSNCNMDSSKKDRAFEEIKIKSLVEKSVELGSRGPKMANKSGSYSGVVKEKGVSDEGKGSGPSVNKYPSKLHEKLAFLEGKVKRIATDIKKTKEMLDVNNPDASKVILSDIQEKISGIEKAMGSAVKVEIVKSNEIDEGKSNDTEKRQEKQILDGKSSVKGLSAEELEARLFPHHKLLKDRTSAKSSSMTCQSDEVEMGEEKSSNPIEEHPVELEFLASLNKEKDDVTTKDGNVDSGISEIQEADDAFTSAAETTSSNLITCKSNLDIVLTTNEKFDEFEDQENRSEMIIEEETENNFANQLNEIGRKTSTGGWFVSEGESVLLAHDDGSCTFYDIANCEEKAEYRPPVGISPNMWRDCWIVRAPGADGCSGRYVVAASAGNSIDSGFCSWDFYSKDVRAFHTEDVTTNTRTALSDLPNNTMYRRNALSTILPVENQQWWYKPCGPLIVSTASSQRAVKVFDIRDGEHIMTWELQKPVTSMDYSSPLQWRNRGKVVIAEADSISLWDVSSLNPQALLSISSNRKISALHINNTDAELGGGVRHRVSSSEAEGNDGVFCTADSINVIDFRQPSGIGLKIPKVGVNVQSTFSRGDSIYIGCTSLKSVGKKQFHSQIQQFSIRKQGLFSTYALPESDAHFHYKAITQVWGNSSFVMGSCGLGLYVFDSKDEALQSFTLNHANTQTVREVIGPDDLYSPSFDYLASRVLLISRDRPALWRDLL